MFGLTPVLAGGMSPSNDNLLQGIAKDSGYDANTNETTIAEQAGNIIKSVLTLVGTIFLVLAVYGGITWMTAMGNSDKIEKAREIIVAAVIGVTISAGAYGITYFVFSKLGTNTQGVDSGTLCCCPNEGKCEFITYDESKGQASCEKIDQSYTSSDFSKCN